MMRFLRQLLVTGAKIGSPFRCLELTFWFVLSPGRHITRALVDSSCFLRLDILDPCPFWKVSWWSSISSVKNLTSMWIFVGSVFYSQKVNFLYAWNHRRQNLVWYHLNRKEPVSIGLISSCQLLHGKSVEKKVALPGSFSTYRHVGVPIHESSARRHAGDHPP